jgi:hypothetical protein
LLPVRLLRPEFVPKNELMLPIVLLRPADVPTNVLSPPVLALPAFIPKKVFCVPALLRMR